MHEFELCIRNAAPGDYFVYRWTVKLNGSSIKTNSTYTIRGAKAAAKKYVKQYLHDLQRNDVNRTFRWSGKKWVEVKDNA